MSVPKTRPSERNGRARWLGVALVCAAGLYAYRPLWLATNAWDIEGVLFRPEDLPSIGVPILVAWLLWRRRNSLRALPADRAPLAACLLCALGLGLFVWSQLTGKFDLLLPSLTAHALGFAAWTRGKEGLRWVLFPSLVLLLGLQLPRPLEDEIVWRLQVGTARSAGWLLEVLGRDVIQSGVILRDAEHTFHVIDSCSGLNGIAILTGIALIVRELFAEARLRSWLLIPIAPLLGFPLNVLRVTYVAASPDPEALAGVEGDHTAQGLAVVMAGTAILYALGWLLARGTNPDEALPASDGSVRGLDARTWLAAAGWLALLGLLSATLPRFPGGQEEPRHSMALALPEQRSGWRGRAGPHDPLFTGVFSAVLHRRYELAGPSSHPAAAVDLMIGLIERDRPAATRLVSSKLLVPGPEWDLVRRQREPLWLLGREADVALASRRPGGERALVYAWRPGDEGLWSESWRSLLALDASPFRRSQPQRVVRVIAYAPHEGQLALDHARQTLNRFIQLFREELDAL
jgi:exosortase